MNTEVSQTLKRDDHWQLLLHDFIEANKTIPFSYDSSKGTDCASFVADAVAAMTGTDIAAAFRGTYTTRLGALRAMKKVTGSSTLEDVAVFVTNQFGMKEHPNVKFAQRGDVVLFDGEEGQALGFVSLNGREALFIGEDGLHKNPVKTCRRAWKVGV